MMDDISHFESRRGNLACTSREVFDFVTDIRNFERFIPSSGISDWHSERESCSFRVSMIGTVSFRLERKELYDQVVFKGDALKKNDFSLMLKIEDSNTNMTGVKISLDADLNPVLRMMAAKPIALFLEALITEMENFKEWRNITL